MSPIERVQAYLAYMIEARREGHTLLRVGPFAVALHPTDAALESNVALPQQPAIETGDGWLEDLRSTFRSRGRVPAIQWIAEYAPRLANILRADGFAEQRRETLLVCARESLRAPSRVAGLAFVTLTKAAPLADVRESLDANEFGFDPATAQPATDEQAERFRATLGAARAFTARLDGHAAGAGMFTTPHEGVTELTGIATLKDFRGRGVATALTAYMARAAFAQGCDLVFLSTANPIAQRAYQRAGFQPAGTLLISAASAV